MTKYFSVAETAKLVRSALKDQFPGVKFSVKSKSYSGGASITIGWIDGPTVDQVKAISNQFEGAEFDGMQDLKTYVSHNVNGETVHYGADYIFCNRDVSEGKLCAALELYYQKYTGNFKDAGIPKPTIEQYLNGHLYICLPGLHSNVGGLNVQADVRRLAHSL